MLRCHAAAFEALGGAPAEILYDRMKTVVDREVAQNGPEAGHIVYNRTLVEYANWGMGSPWRVQSRSLALARKQRQHRIRQHPSARSKGMPCSTTLRPAQASRSAPLWCCLPA